MVVLQGDAVCLAAGAVRDLDIQMMVSPALLVAQSRELSQKAYKSIFQKSIIW